MKEHDCIPGIRCKVYATLNGVKAETKGVVLGVRDDDMLRIKLVTGQEIVAHPKQVRRLVVKRRRRIFVKESELPREDKAGMCHLYPDNPRCLEFVEVTPYWQKKPGERQFWGPEAIR